MALAQLSLETFKGVVLDWWAGWCAPCRAFAPIFEGVAAANPDVTFGKVDTEAQADLAGAYGIRSIPTVSIFRDGILVFEQPGVLPRPQLEGLLQKVRALDMDEVRRHLAPRAGSQPERTEGR